MIRWNPPEEEASDGNCPEVEGEAEASDGCADSVCGENVRQQSKRRLREPCFSRDSGVLKMAKTMDCIAGVHHEAARRVGNKPSSYGNAQRWPTPYNKGLTYECLSSPDPGRCGAKACQGDSQSTKAHGPSRCHLDGESK